MNNLKPLGMPDTARAVALAFYRSTGGDVKKAARLANVAPHELKRWIVEELDADPALREQQRVVIAKAVNARPRPPADLTAPLNFAQDFSPAPDLETWVLENILSPLGPLYNSDHHHLNQAHIGYVWTNVPMRRTNKTVAGTCEMPKVEGDWAKARFGFLLNQWFSGKPDFLITLDSAYATQCSDAAFCALVEHELYHCGQAEDLFGQPRFHKETGNPIFAVRGHDVEEFVGVVGRYGAGEGAGDTARFVHAASFEPTVAEASIRAACGVCLRV